MIDSTRFGSITIDGKTYESDVIVTWEWKVKEAKTETRHVIGEADLLKIIFERPDSILIGTGQDGEMKIAKGVMKFAKAKKINILEQPTPEAVKTFNRLVLEGKRVVAYMHVTC